MTLFQIASALADTTAEKAVSVVDSATARAASVLADSAQRSAVPLEPSGTRGLDPAWIGVLGAVVGAIIAVLGPFLLKWYRQRKVRLEKDAETRDALKTEEIRYLQWVVNEHRFLPISGLRTRTPVEVELEQVYVSLKVDRGALARMHQEGGEESVRRSRSEDLSALQGGEDEDDISISDGLKLLDDDRVSGLVVLGGPGTGKTTVLKYLALTYARGLYGERLGQARPLLPVFVTLRALASGRPLPALADYLTGVCRDAGCGVSEGFFAEKLRDSSCIILLDGLDEVADRTQRRQVAEWIERQCNVYSNNPFVVTCRTAGFQEAYLPPRFLRLDIRDFTAEDVARFARNWCAAVETMLLGDPEEGREKGEQAGENLVRAIEANDRVKALAVNPLLLSIIALVHRYRAWLPDRRVDLYTECVEVLLGHWDEAKDLEVSIPPGRSLQVLQPLALWMHEQKEVEEGERLAHRDEIIPVIAPHLVSIGMKAEDAGGFLDSIRDRSGLLVERGPNIFGFQHQTFQEYLAAWEISETSQDDLLATHFGEGYWQEVTLLCAGIRDASGPVKALLGLPGEKLAEHWRLLMQVMNEVLSVDEATRSAVFTRPFDILKQTADPDTAVRASLWLRKGRPDVDALIRAFDEAPNELEKGHFALLLGETGDETAIDLLKPHLTDDSRHVRYLSALALDMLGFEDRKALDDLLMVRVDAGEFTMGSEEAFGAETPRKIETGAFLIDRFPVANTQYRRFIEAAGYRERRYWSDEGWTWKEKEGRSKPAYFSHPEFGIPAAPVVGITVYEAEAYATWAEKRLPTEVEWERAARGDQDAREYPWGNTFQSGRDNVDGVIGQTSPVGSYPNGMSPHGCYDMLGNVWEWTADVHERFGPARVVRGGLWGGSPHFARCSYRSRGRPGGRFYFLGVRFSRTI